MAAYRDHITEFAASGARVFGLSVDGVEKSRWFARSLNLPFPILCDSERAVVRAWGLLNEKEHGGIAFPSTWVIDAERKVGFCSLERTAARVDPRPVLSFLRGADATSTARARAVFPDLAAFARGLFQSWRR